MRETPAGQYLWKMGRDYYDTESAARRVAEQAAADVAELTDALRALRNVIHDEELNEATIEAVAQADEILNRK